MFGRRRRRRFFRRRNNLNPFTAYNVTITSPFTAIRARLRRLVEGGLLRPMLRDRLRNRANQLAGERLLLGLNIDRIQQNINRNHNDGGFFAGRLLHSPPHDLPLRAAPPPPIRHSPPYSPENADHSRKIYRQDDLDDYEDV